MTNLRVLTQKPDMAFVTFPLRMIHAMAHIVLTQIPGAPFRITKNRLDTANHDMAPLHFGPNVVYPCFVLAQPLIVCGMRLLETHLGDTEDFHEAF